MAMMVGEEAASWEGSTETLGAWRGAAVVERGSGARWVVAVRRVVRRVEGAVAVVMVALRVAMVATVAVVAMVAVEAMVGAEEVAAAQAEVVKRTARCHIRGSASSGTKWRGHARGTRGGTRRESLYRSHTRRRGRSGSASARRLRSRSLSRPRGPVAVAAVEATATARVDSLGVATSGELMEVGVVCELEEGARVEQVASTAARLAAARAVGREGEEVAVEAVEPVVSEAVVEEAEAVMAVVMERTDKR